MQKNPEMSLTDVFGAILNFVNDLTEVFGTTKNVTPLSLYHRLLQHIKFSDRESMLKSVSGFSDFFKLYDSIIEANEMDKIPRETVIRYGDSERVYLEIQKFIYKSSNNEEMRDSIRSHLLTISAMITPTKEKIALLDAPTAEDEDGNTLLPVDLNSKEGKFINGIMTKTQNAVKNIQTDDPMKAIMGLMQSGVLTDLMGGLKAGVEGGEMDPNKLMDAMQGMLASARPKTTKKAAVNTDTIKDIPLD